MPSTERPAVACGPQVSGSVGGDSSLCAGKGPLPRGEESFTLAASLPSPGPWRQPVGGGQAGTCVPWLQTLPASGGDSEETQRWAPCLAPPHLSRAQEGGVGQGQGGWVAL